MSGETNLTVLLKNMQPILHKEMYVFCTTSDSFNIKRLNPVCLFQEAEGTTLILQQAEADSANLPYRSTFRMITLSIHSSLEAVGFLAAITGKLAEHGISVNPVSAYYHDHLFVPAAQADTVMALLNTF